MDDEEEEIITIELIIHISNHAQRIIERLPDAVREIFIYGDILYAYFQEHPNIDIEGPPLDYEEYLAYVREIEFSYHDNDDIPPEMEERRKLINYYVTQWDIYFTYYEETHMNQSISIDLDRFYQLESFHITQIYTYEIINMPSTLSKLLCKSCQLRKLGNIPENIYMINCSGNELHYMPHIYHTKLNALFCSANQLRVLPKLPTTLECLYCYHNNLRTLPKLPEPLTDLSCGNNTLRELPELPEKLQNIYCGHNMLTTIPPFA